VGAVTSWLWLGVWLLILVPYYSVIVRYEESNLLSIGQSYKLYFANVGRWLPRGNDLSQLTLEQGPKWSIMSALRSERTTLCAIAAILAALYFI
jgi:hypothetical protein